MSGFMYEQPHSRIMRFRVTLDSKNPSDTRLRIASWRKGNDQFHLGDEIVAHGWSTIRSMARRAKV